MKKVAIAFGSNLGDRNLNIRIGIEKILQTGVRFVAISSLYETQAIGFETDNLFLNGVIVIQTPHEAETLLRQLQQIEADLGRVRPATIGYTDRPLDLDILIFGDEQIDTEILKVPHPNMTTRAFVMVPLAEIWPDWVHPDLGVSAQQLAFRLKDQFLSKINPDSVL